MLKKPLKPLRLFFCLLSVLLPLLLLPLCARSAEVNSSLQMLLGNPDRAAKSSSNRQKRLTVRPQLAMSYNDSLRFPNWVAWHLSRGDILREPWTRYTTTVADIERAIGLRFFTALPVQVASALKTRRDLGTGSGRDDSRLAGGQQRPGGGSSSSNTGTTSPPSSASSADLVWVNTRSGVYWRKGTQFYGKTRQGKFLTEKDALAQVYRAAQGQ